MRKAMLNFRNVQSSDAARSVDLQDFHHSKIFADNVRKSIKLVSALRGVNNSETQPDNAR